MLRSLLLEATLAKLPAEAQITVVATAEVVATVEAVVFAVSVMPVAMDEAIVATVAVIGVRLGATPGRMGWHGLRRSPCRCLTGYALTRASPSRSGQHQRPLLHLVDARIVGWVGGDK